MGDINYKELAADYIAALDLAKGEKVFIEYGTAAGAQMARACADAAIARGASAQLYDVSTDFMLSFDYNKASTFRDAAERLQFFEALCEQRLYFVEGMNAQAYINIVDGENPAKAQMTQGYQQRYDSAMKSVVRYRTENMRTLTILAPKVEASAKRPAVIETSKARSAAVINFRPAY